MYCCMEGEDLTEGEGKSYSVGNKPYTLWKNHTLGEQNCYLKGSETITQWGEKELFWEMCCCVGVGITLTEITGRATKHENKLLNEEEEVIFVVIHCWPWRQRHKEM